jgi:hypothetical protein
MDLTMEARYSDGLDLLEHDAVFVGVSSCLALKLNALLTPRNVGN